MKNPLKKPINITSVQVEQESILLDIRKRCKYVKCGKPLPLMSKVYKTRIDKEYCDANCRSKNYYLQNGGSYSVFRLSGRVRLDKENPMIILYPLGQKSIKIKITKESKELWLILNKLYLKAEGKKKRES